MIRSEKVKDLYPGFIVYILECSDVISQISRSLVKQHDNGAYRFKSTRNQAANQQQRRGDATLGEHKHAVCVKTSKMCSETLKSVFIPCLLTGSQQRGEVSGLGHVARMDACCHGNSILLSDLICFPSNKTCNISSCRNTFNPLTLHPAHSFGCIWSLSSGESRSKRKQRCRSPPQAPERQKPGHLKPKLSAAPVVHRPSNTLNNDPKETVTKRCFSLL